MGCHFLLQGNLLDPGIEPRSPALQADTLTSEPPGKTLIGVASSVTKWLLRKSNVWHFVINHPGTPLFVIFFLFYLLSFSSLLFFFLLSLFVIPQSLLSYVDLYADIPLYVFKLLEHVMA